MRAYKAYELTDAEKSLAIEIAPICKLADESTAYDLIIDKIKERASKGIYIDESRIEILIKVAKNINKRKGCTIGNPLRTKKGLW